MEKELKDFTDTEIKAKLWELGVDKSNLQRMENLLLNELVKRSSQPEMTEPIEEKKEDKE